MDIVISPSTKKNKKYKAVIDGKKEIHFGSSAHSDFTRHKDTERKERYIARTSNQDHSKQNIASPAWMSRWISWHKPTIEESIKDLNKKYKDVNFKYKK